MIILAGVARSRTIMRSSALFSLGSGGCGGSRSSKHAFVPLFGRQSERGNVPRIPRYVSSMDFAVYPRKSLHALDMISDSIEHDANDVQDIISPDENYCYLLRSLDSDHPLKTYIGFTTNPQRRLRQHNGELIRGARRTKSGRPWEYVAIISGFLDKVSAMQFEWAWQHVDRSKVFRDAMGSDKDARRMKRRRGVIARLNDLSILLNDCAPFNTLPLKFHYLDEEYHVLFCNLTGEDQYDVLLATQGGTEDRILAFNDVNQMMGPSLASVNRDSLTNMLCFGKSRRLINSIACNSLVRMGSMPKSTWALNSVSAPNVQESISDDNVGTDDFEQVVKTPSKFKPYPFTVSNVVAICDISDYNFILIDMNYFFSITRS